MVLTEVYFQNSNITKEQWQNFISIISKYNGIFHKWYLYLVLDENKIHYYIKTRCVLPTTVSHLEQFLLKQTDINIDIQKDAISLPILHKYEQDFADICGYYETRKKRKLKLAKIKILPIFSHKFLSNTYLFFIKKNKIIKTKYLWNDLSSFLSIDFSINKRFFYQKIPKYLKLEKQLNLLKRNNNNSIIKIDTFPYLQGDYYLDQNEYQVDKHSLILGSSGSGKSKFLSSVIKNIYENKEKRLNYRIVVIDPHASLENDIGGLSDTKIIDFKEKQDTINPFISISEDYVASTELFLSLFKTLMQEQYNSKLERVLRYSIHFLLISKLFDFKNLRRLILDVEYRSELLRQHKMKIPISVMEFFLNDFSELKTNFYGEAISPIISFIDEMQLLPVFNESSLEYENLEKIIKQNFLTIFSLDQTKLGLKITKTMAGLIMQQILGFVQARTFNEHLILILDEISVIQSPIICRLLSEARKYNVSVFLAGQYLNQVSEDLKDAIFANVINYYTFRISKLDAETIVNNINIDIPLENTIEYKIKMLTELPDRTCILRVSNGSMIYPAMKGSTLDFISVPYIRKKQIISSDLQNESKLKKKFSFSKNTSLNDLLKETSTSRKELK